MPIADLDEVITDSISDAELPDDPVEEPAEEVQEAPEPAQEEEISDQEGLEIESPAARAEKAPKPEPDEFEKKFGITPQSASGRENRIPYPRVKKIVEKAVTDNTKTLEASWKPKEDQYVSKITDYETKLHNVAKFEEVMLNDVPKFVSMLKTIPAYKDYFDKLEAQKPDPASLPVPTGDEMPEPDQKLSDGSMVYSLDGLKALLAWQSKQTESRLSKQVEQQYGPLRQQHEAQEKINRMIPQIQAQIDDARKWPQFNDNEEAIVKALQADQSLSLERAYQQVVYPKLVADRTRMREEILAEIKKAPVGSTSVQSRGGTTRPGLQSKGGSRSLESIIEESIQALK